MEREQDRPASVFVSYSRTDQKRALPVIKALEEAGCTVWWDGLLEGGETYLKTTEAALEGADAVVVLWSRTSVDSHWVRDEATRGRDRRRLVPLSIDGSEPPLGFRQFQVIDVSRWKGKAAAPEFAAVLRAVRAMAGQEDAATPAPRLAPPPLSRRAVIAGGGAAALGLAGLAAWKGGLLGSGAPQRDSVAVLPFRNLAGNPEEDYFAAGLAEEIRTALSRVPELRVLAPDSVAAVKNLAAAPAELARKLGVEFLLGGSVRRAEGKLRISATLTDGKSGFTAWTEQFDRPLEDIFAIQDDIADNVAAAMAAQATGVTRLPGQGLGGTRSLNAYDAMLRGNAYYELRNGEASMRAALAQYETAIATDGNYAEAHAARARVLIGLANETARYGEAQGIYQDAIGSARRAVQLAPRLALAQSTLGYVLTQGQLDLRAAREPFELSRKLGSGDSLVLRLYAPYCAELGRKADAAAAATRAIELDPLNPGAFRVAAFVHYCARDYGAAKEACLRAQALNPRISTVSWYLGLIHLAQGDADKARTMFMAEQVEILKLTGLAIAERSAGNAAASDQAFARLQGEYGDAATYQRAQVLAQWGRVDEALAALDRARQIGDIGLALAGVDPLLDPLRGRPEYSRLLQGLGLG